MRSPPPPTATRIAGRSGPTPAGTSSTDAAALLSLPLAGGLAFTTHADLVTDQAAAAQLSSGHPGLTTLAISVVARGFLLTDPSGRQSVRSGAELASSLGFVPLYGADVRLWLAWPTDSSARDVLENNLYALADTAGATVWTPPAGATVVCLDGCRDLATQDRRGQPRKWLAYQPSANLQHLVNTRNTYLLPAAWLDRVRLVGAYTVDAHGLAGEHTDVPSTSLMLRCSGARHGADGLPNEVVRWAPPPGDHQGLRGHSRRHRRAAGGSGSPASAAAGRRGRTAPGSAASRRRPGDRRGSQRRPAGAAHRGALTPG